VNARVVGWYATTETIYNLLLPLTPGTVVFFHHFEKKRKQSCTSRRNQSVFRCLAMLGLRLCPLRDQFALPRASRERSMPAT